MADPNKNIMIVQQIENLAFEIAERLGSFEAKTLAERRVVDQAKEDLAIWREVDLHAVRQEFE